MTVDEFFAGHDESRRLFDRVREAVASVGPAQVRVTRSQVVFRRRRGFASAWMPGQYLGATDVPLVLTVGGDGATTRRAGSRSSSRWGAQCAPGA